LIGWVKKKRKVSSSDDKTKKMVFHFSQKDKIRKNGGKAISLRKGGGQGCQTVCFQTKIPNLGIFGSASD
jgi:hypothetical protein